MGAIWSNLSRLVHMEDLNECNSESQNIDLSQTLNLEENILSLNDTLGQHMETGEHSRSQDFDLIETHGNKFPLFKKDSEIASNIFNIFLKEAPYKFISFYMPETLRKGNFTPLCGYQLSVQPISIAKNEDECEETILFGYVIHLDETFLEDTFIAKKREAVCYKNLLYLKKEENEDQNEIHLSINGQISKLKEDSLENNSNDTFKDIVSSPEALCKDLIPLNYSNGAPHPEIMDNQIESQFNYLVEDSHNKNDTSVECSFENESPGRRGDCINESKNLTNYQIQNNVILIPSDSSNYKISSPYECNENSPMRTIRPMSIMEIPFVNHDYLNEGLPMEIQFSVDEIPRSLNVLNEIYDNCKIECNLCASYSYDKREMRLHYLDHYGIEISRNYSSLKTRDGHSVCRICFNVIEKLYEHRHYGLDHDVIRLYVSKYVYDNVFL